MAQVLQEVVASQKFLSDLRGLAHHVELQRKQLDRLRPIINKSYTYRLQVPQNFCLFLEKATLLGRRRLWRVSGVIASAPAFLGLEVFGEIFKSFARPTCGRSLDGTPFPPLPLCAS